MTATILRADARRLPLPDASVDLIVTSPPYFALRSYTDGGEHYAGQIGAEPTPAEYIASLIECTREWVRVLKPGGSIFVNLGDKYNSGPRGNAGYGSSTLRTPNRNFDEGGRRAKRHSGIPEKCLMMLPERYRIAAVDELGLIARAVIVWSKPNGLPESVTDRVRRSHEDWVHLTKQPRYFSAVDEIREQHAGEFLASGARNPRYGRPNGRMPAEVRGEAGTNRTPTGEWEKQGGDARHPLGKLPGSVWEIATEPLKVPDHLGVDHFAAFPTEWPRRIIQGWSPSGICTACGEGRRPVSERDRPTEDRSRVALAAEGRTRRLGVTSGLRTNATAGEYPATRITGEACACPDTSAPTRPAVVFDPFGGTGTTALVASVLGRHGISVDRSADYGRLARWRTTDPGQRAKAARVTAPTKQLEGQQDLFGELIA